MKIREKYNVNLNDYTYNYAQYDMGTLREVLDDSAAIWRSHDDDDYYTLDPKVVVFYEDLDNALTNFEELEDALQNVITRLYEYDDAPVVDYWITNHFYQSLDDANEMIHRFARWEEARESFIEMITMEAIENKRYEPLLHEFFCETF